VYQKVKNKPEYKAKKKIHSLRYNYGLSEAEYEAMLIQQDNKCKICRSEQGLFVDHNHLTGKVRGLICRNCNTAIGMLKADNGTQLIESTLKYISEDSNAKSDHPEVPSPRI
jgi:hypothetical protein